MGLKHTIEVLNGMLGAGVIGRYAIAGAVGAIYYLEVSATDDLDVLVSFDAGGPAKGGSPGLIVLTPIINHLAKLGFTEFRHEGIVVDGWPVQFLPVAGPLDEAALANAAEVTFAIPGEPKSVATWVLRAEYLVAKAVELQRPKDIARIGQFLDEQAVDLLALADVLAQYRLAVHWSRFCQVTGRDDPIRDILVT